ncbi:PHB depolymerase family esterase [Caldimonas brevitalea]|uniref:Chitinase n=1 Tax=Caldimonas brevitalea TaxID=413882 RepID=A0A0G3BJN3_9BURK|nr:PHB depolymerase family esterase [Caldimonas brevitalea]AKJ28193.1 chitinase [Caldimonas brevitalea]
MVAAVGSGVRAADELPPLGVDRGSVTISGLSSGGYMAVQMLVAHSASIAGAGLVAAGPYDCAEGQVQHAQGRCLGRGAIPTARLVAATRRRAAAGLIDPVRHLTRARVYLFSGRLDTAVPTAVTDELQRYLLQWIPPRHIRYRKDIDAEHGMVTDDHGNRCDQRGGAYLNNCGFDLAGELLQHLYGGLAPRRVGALQGRLLTFDQTPYLRDRGFGPTGWLFVPPGCAPGTPACRLHVVLHGCGQNPAQIGDAYVRHAGYNRWADTNRIVVLYPQTGDTAPMACWDWWGYTGWHYPVQQGLQITALRSMIERLATRDRRCYSATLWEHLRAGRVGVVWGRVYARGSQRPLGWFWPTARYDLVETGPQRYEPKPCRTSQ